MRHVSKEDTLASYRTDLKRNEYTEWASVEADRNIRTRIRAEAKPRDRKTDLYEGEGGRSTPSTKEKYEVRLTSDPKLAGNTRLGNPENFASNR